MKALKQQIEQAATSEELETIVDNMPRQDNGERTKLARILDDCFWYVWNPKQNILEQQKRFLLDRIDFYGNN